MLKIPLTWRYLLTIVDAKNLQEQYLPLRAAMLLAMSSDDQEVTMTNDCEQFVAKSDEKDDDSGDGSKGGKGGEGGGKQEVEDRSVLSQLSALQADLSAFTAERKEREEREEREAREERETKEKRDEQEEEEDELEEEESDQAANSGDDKSERGRKKTEEEDEEEEEQEEEQEDQEDEPEEHEVEQEEHEEREESEEQRDLPEKHRRHKAIQERKYDPPPTKKHASSSESDSDDFSQVAASNEKAAKKVINKFTKLRGAIKKHAKQFELMLKELEMLDPQHIAPHLKPNSHPNLSEDHIEFEAFLEHQRLLERASPESMAATAKRLETEKYEGRQRFARNTAKLISIAAPVIDTNSLTADPDVAAALQECSSSSGVVSQVLGHPVATLALTCAQMVGANLRVQAKAKDPIYNTDKWRQYVATKRG